MSKPDRQTRTVGEVALDVVEVVGAAVACAVIASAPVWFSLLAAGLLGPWIGVPAFLFALFFVVVLPQLPMRERPELDGYQRWGLRMGRLLRAPITWAEARRARRTTRALSSSTSSSSAAAPSLPPAKAASKHNRG